MIRHLAAGVLAAGTIPLGLCSSQAMRVRLRHMT